MSRSLSIIIPAFDEQARLPETIRKIQAFLETITYDFHEILVVDDGSRDRTVEVAAEFARADPNIRVLRNPGNRGKGYSVKHGMMECRGEWALFTDADLSTPITEIEKLFDAVAREGAEIAIGSRALDRSLIAVHQPGFRETAGKFFNALMRAFIGLPISDTQCGFKLFRADAARRAFSLQTLERFGFDVEVLFIASKLGYRISEVPVRWSNVEGSKVGVFTGLQAFAELAQVWINNLRGRYK